MDVQRVASVWNTVAGDIGYIEIVSEFFIEDMADPVFDMCSSHVKGSSVCFPVFLLGEPCIVVAGDDHGDAGMTRFIEIAGQGSYDIGQSTHLGGRIAFRTYHEDMGSWSCFLFNWLG